MKKVIKIDGMSCEHCQKRVENALSELNGVASVVVSLEAGTAEVDFDEAVIAEAALTEAIEEAGYDVMS